VWVLRRESSGSSFEASTSETSSEGVGASERAEEGDLIGEMGRAFCLWMVSVGFP
jgi:hypothetical protein